MINVGVLTANRNKDGDELYTPAYAVQPIIKYIPEDKIVWCPFDKADSQFCLQLSRGA